MGAVEKEGTGETNEIERGRVVAHPHGATCGNAVKVKKVKRRINVASCRIVVSAVPLASDEIQALLEHRFSKI